MAIVERGKGKNRHSIEIVQNGVVLRMQEVESGNDRLPGYRRLSSPEVATATLAAEVQAHLADGMKPADEEARAIAAGIQSPKPGTPTLPLRCDLGIYNEATGLVVTSRRMAGKVLDEGSAEWKKAVNRGDMLPLTLMQDDPFVIRVVAGEPLTAQEESEWVARVDWHLNISDGQLCVTGGSVFSNEGYDDAESYSEQFVGEVAIPKGRYKASLYSMLFGINGSGVMDHLAGGYDKGESVEDWMARTRPGQNMPNWDADEGPEVVGFLLHLEPIDAAPKKGLSELPDEGWFGGAENARQPELCPLGLDATDVRRRTSTESGGWTYIRDTFRMLKPKWGNATPDAFTDGRTVALPLTGLGRASRLAWFASRHTVLELRLQPPADTTVDLSGEWPEGVVAAEEPGVVRLLFSADLDPVTVLERVGQLASHLTTMPAGTVLDLCAAPVEYVPDIQATAGWLWLRGTLRDGKWVIARALPAVASTQLEAALALAGEVESASIAVTGDAERSAIMSWAKRNFGHHLNDNPPHAHNGAITFKKPGYEVQLLGIAAFANRFSDVWPAWDGAAAVDGDDEDEDEDDGLFPGEAIKGALLYTTPGGRGFHQTMALLISQGVDGAVRAQEKSLKKAGFKEVGDVMCAEFEQVAFHCYLHNAKTSVAWFRVSYPDEATCEILSLFVGGALLLTSANSQTKNKASKGVHVQEFFDATPAELAAHHERRVTELQAQLGSPREIAPGVKSMAEALAVVLEKD